MNIETIVYLAGVSGDLKALLIAIGIISVIILLAYVFNRALEGESLSTVALKVLLSTIFVTLFLQSFIPSQTTIYTMVGARMAKEAVNSEIGVKVQKLISNKLDSLLASEGDKK